MADRKQRRPKRDRDFYRRYWALCRLKNYQPIEELNLQHQRRNAKSVDFYGDRCKDHDWQLIADALADDGLLETLAIRLRQVYGDGPTLGPELLSSHHRQPPRPTILNVRLLERLIRSVTSFLQVNRTVQTLILEALPIRREWTETLISGLKDATTLAELSFARSAIGDDGCAAICSTVKLLPNLETLNLGSCHLSSNGCRHIVDLVTFQKLQRCAIFWQQSLRYREIQAQQQHGVRYLVLNNNPAIGDEGIEALTEALKDDYWVRCVDFRNCGLTDFGARSLKECLEMNEAIERFDIRDNDGISIDAWREVFGKPYNELDGLHDAKKQKSPSEGDGVSSRNSAKFYQQQLESERHRRGELEKMVTELHRQIAELGTQTYKIKKECAAAVDDKHKLLQRINDLEQHHQHCFGMRPISPSSTSGKRGASMFFKKPTEVIPREQHNLPAHKMDMLERYVEDQRVITGESVEGIDSNLNKQSLSRDPGAGGDFEMNSWRAVKVQADERGLSEDSSQSGLDLLRAAARSRGYNYFNGC